MANRVQTVLNRPVAATTLQKQVPRAEAARGAGGRGLARRIGRVLAVPGYVFSPAVRSSVAALVVVALSAALPCLAVRAQGGEGHSTTRPAERSAATGDAGSSLPADDPRRGARIEVVLDKEEYFLGENVLLHYHVRSRGKEPFRISIGGDSRTPDARRALRFKVEATDRQGRKALDPYPHPDNFGGMGGEPVLGPGQEFWEDLQLMRYREFTRPGTYSIQVYHDLGWEKRKGPPFPAILDSGDIPKGPHNAPTVAAIVRLVMPNPQQARQVVEAMLKLPADANRTWGERGRPFADFELLRYPVYLPVVKELAQKGDGRGLDAIGAMAFPEATEALLELTRHRDAAMASKAEQSLLRRMPPVFPSKRPSRQSYLAERSWRDDLKARALETAWRLLAKGDRESQIRAGWLIRSLGGKDDLPALVRAMDKLLPAYQDNDTEQRAWLRPPTVCETLSHAAGDLIHRGAEPPAAGTPGQAVAFLAGLKASKDFRPSGWQTTLESLLKHDIPFIRAVALQSTPLPLTDAAADAVAARIKDEFPPVQGAACDLAGKSKLARFGQPLTDVLRTTPNHWVLRSAFQAAAACGADMDRLLEILVGRLEPRSNDKNMVLLGLMLDGAIQHQGGYGAQRHDDWSGFLGDLQTAWREFIHANRRELRGGKRFKIAQPPVKREMFPPKFQFHRAGQSPWPDWTSQASQRNIPLVSSLAQLRALPAVAVNNDWELRVALAEPGIEGAPWKLLYAHYRYAGDKQDLLGLPLLGYHSGYCVLGPLGWRVDYAPPGRLGIARRLMVNRLPPTRWIRKPCDRVYCATVPTPLAGTYTVRVGTASAGAQGSIVVEKPPALAWTPLLRRPEKGDADSASGSRLTMAPVLRAAMPCYCDGPIWWPGDEKEDEPRRSLYAKALPGQCPTVSGWAECGPFNSRQSRTVSPLEPLRFALSVREGRLVLAGEPAQVARPQDHFLARWWINGKPVTAGLAARRMTRKRHEREKIRPPDARAELAVPLVLPEWTSARVKPGDEMGLQAAIPGMGFADGS